MNSETLPEKKEPPRFEPWWVLALSAIWLGIGFVPKLDSSPGTFGDMFGMVNSLFSGLAFLGLIHTIRLQMHEISLQRRELELTRGELERSADAQSASAEALALQVIISSITAQITTALQRRATASQNERDIIDHQKAGIFSIRTANGTKTTEEVLKESRNAMSHLTEEIDLLSNRLREYDKRLCAELDKVHTQ